MSVSPPGQPDQSFAEPHILACRQNNTPPMKHETLVWSLSARSKCTFIRETRIVHDSAPRSALAQAALWPCWIPLDGKASLEVHQSSELEIVLGRPPSMVSHSWWSERGPKILRTLWALHLPCDVRGVWSRSLTAAIYAS